MSPIGSQISNDTGKRQAAISQRELGPYRSAEQPCSLLALERKGLRDPVPGLLPDGYSRIIGEPRFYKGFAKIFSCQIDGVRDLTLQKRDALELFKALKHKDATPVQQWTVVGGRIEPS